MEEEANPPVDLDHDAQHDSPEELAELVHHYRVCWEMWPLRLPRDGQLVQVGFELDLLGTPPGDRGSLLPGQERGLELFQALGRIAHWAAAKAPPSVEYEFRLFSSAIHYSERRRNRPDITLAIEIVHRADYGAALDADQVECVRGLIDSLTSLGVQQTSWKEPPSGTGRANETTQR